MANIGLHLNIFRSCIFNTTQYSYKGLVLTFMWFLASENCWYAQTCTFLRNTFIFTRYRIVADRKTFYILRYYLRQRSCRSNVTDTTLCLYVCQFVSEQDISTDLTDLNQILWNEKSSTKDQSIRFWQWTGYGPRSSVCDCVCVCVCVCVFVYLCVCPHDKTETAENTITELGTGIVYRDTSPTN